MLNFKATLDKDEAYKDVININKKAIMVIKSIVPVGYTQQIKKIELL